ncbi:hypothetical protein [Janthinobacterium sp. PC23-8]|uniref:hypothetical protein n=1 Tax=Janthinobacterium sp. PC23-8 TaxID=2012679 RepID=UPI001595C988|nr:hypothetical protein [Janthinobacterium sp. PC23-8]
MHNHQHADHRIRLLELSGVLTLVSVARLLCVGVLDGVGTLASGPAAISQDVLVKE